MSIFDRLTTARLSIGRLYKGTKGTLYSGLTSVSGINSYVPKSLKIAPHNLKTADPIIAQEFYGGRYSLGGEVINVNGKSPFIIKTENEDWLKELHSFTWLLHFSENSNSISDSHARVLVQDWIELSATPSTKWVWDIETTAKRLISLLCHSIILLSKPDPNFHHLLMRSLGKHIKVLRRHLVDAPEGMPLLLTTIALSYASVTFTGTSSSLAPFNDKLAKELQKQILPDGGHISRNPAVIPEILSLILSLKQAFDAAAMAPPKELVMAIERMFPAMRFFVHADGSLARFNGCGVTQAGLLATLFRYDEIMGKPVNDAVNSGYQKAEVGASKLIMDTGTPPIGEPSNEAHCGTLSFEFSQASSSLIVNCGKPQFTKPEASQVWRTSNAHSTAILNNTSMAKFENPGTAGRAISGQIFARTFNTETSRTDSETASTIIAAHDGYVREFGIRHQRTLTLDNNGDRLFGQEWFSGPKKANMRYTTKDIVALRFHLHPDIKASLDVSGETCLIETRDGEQWRFDCPGFKVELEESIFFANVPTPKPTWQIMIHTKAYDNPEINWALQKIPAT